MLRSSCLGKETPGFRVPLRGALGVTRMVPIAHKGLRSFMRLGLWGLELLPGKGEAGV